MRLDELLPMLTVKRRRGDEYDCLCPAHGDSVASLQVKEGSDGRILMDCKVCKDNRIVLGALGLSLRDLFESEPEHVTIRPVDPNVGVPTAHYVYHDEEGAPLFRVTRFDMGGGKKYFRQNKYLGDEKWAHDLGDARRVLYQLPGVRDAAKHGRRVLYVEGEKDVHTLEAMGFVATTHAGGANGWKSDYAASLEGAEVVILPDNDGPGRAMAAAIVKDIHGARVYEIPGLPEKGDVSDWVAAGGNREKLQKLLGPEIADMEPVTWEAFQAEKDQPTYYCGEILAEETVNIMVADAGVGKTTLVVQMCLAIASGWPFLGFMKTTPTPVLLLEAEGARGLYRARAEKCRQALRIPADDLRGKWFTQSRWISDFNAGGIMVESQIRRSGAKIVVLDTLGYFLGEGDENSAKDWKQKIMFPLRRLRALYGCSFILLHHEAKPSELRTGHHRGRGTSAMFGDCDTWMSLESLNLSEADREKLPAGWQEEASRERTLKWYKSKVGKMPDPIHLELDIEAAVLTPKGYSVREKLDAMPSPRKARREDF